MRRSVTAFVVILMVFIGSLCCAQTGPTSSDRKVTSRVPAVYPELAKRMHIHGVVRIEAVVRPNGSVKTTRILGGNPVLVDSAMDAVAKWKFETAQSETTQTVQVMFDGQ
ncbi:MAG TPA: energy transducer TonB [Candidatus Sulfotelmatobacter sp.]|nr:energy transducer TonB [Candidatus Sulfotelmatobacter sp.]